MTLLATLLAILLAACSGSHQAVDPTREKDAAARGKTGRSHGGARDADTDDDTGVDDESPDSGSDTDARHDAGGMDASSLSDGQVRDQGDACAKGERCADAASSDSCKSHALKADLAVVAPPSNVLFVYDRSGSMADDWNGQPRWQAAGTAVKNALAPLADELVAGALFFPSADPNAPLMCVDPTGIVCMFVPGLNTPSGTCNVNSLDKGDQIDFAAGGDFLSAFAGASGMNPPYTPVPGGQTPLTAALQEAKLALSDAMLAGPTSVVIITDGDPNCGWDASVAEQIVSDWHAAGIDTYTIGLPGADIPAAQATLDRLASAGGTAESPVSDFDSLEKQVSDVLEPKSRIASCTIHLEDPPADAEAVHLVVTLANVRYEVARDLDGDAGWSLSSDRSVVELIGDLCVAVQSGRYQQLAFESGCVDLPDLPAP